MATMTATLAVIRPEAAGSETVCTTFNHIGLLKDIRTGWLENRDYSLEESRDLADINFEITRLMILMKTL